MSFEERTSSRPSGLLSKVLAGVAVVALLAAMALGGMFLLGNRAGPSPSPTASPTPRPTPTVALQRFAALAASAKRAYHVTFVTTVDTPAVDLTMSGALDVSGNDWKGTTITKSAGKSVRTETVGKAGKIYTRTAGGKWTMSTQAVPAALRDPINSVAGRDLLIDLGVVKRAGKMLHQLHGDSLPDADNQIRALGLSGKLQTFSFDVWVTDTGVPVQAALKVTVSGDAGLSTLTTTFDISRFGKAVKITAPKV
jgi:hypothetical protein